MKNTICVIGDLVASREIDERRVFQEKLGKFLRSIDRSHTISPYTITLGDEFQAVYADPSELFADLICIQSFTYPIRVRFGIGVGELTTRINDRNALGMDGPAFLGAREAITTLKKSGRYYRVEGLSGLAAIGVNLSLDLVSHLSATWKENRLKITAALLEGKRPLKIAEAMVISDSAVYKNIDAGALETVVATFHHIAAQLTGENR